MTTSLVALTGLDEAQLATRHDDLAVIEPLVLGLCSWLPQPCTSRDALLTLDMAASLQRLTGDIGRTEELLNEQRERFKAGDPVRAFLHAFADRDLYRHMTLPPSGVDWGAAAAAEACAPYR